jgi:hypothetical protein
VYHLGRRGPRAAVRGRAGGRNPGEAMTITLTPRERIWLERVLGSQSGRRQDLAAYYAVLERIETTEEHRARYVRQNPATGEAHWNLAAIEQAAGFPVELSSKEAERIRALFDTATFPSSWELRLLEAIDEKIAAAAAAAPRE